MRLEAVEKHVFSKEHVKLLALEKGEFTIYASFLSLVSFFLVILLLWLYLKLN